MRVVAAALLAALACAAPAEATCSFQSITSLQFTYGAVGGGPATAAATMTVSCDAAGSAVSVALDGGLHGGGTIRRLQNAPSGQLLEYNVYLDPGYGTVWGDGTNGTSVQSHAESAGSFALTLYGIIPEGQRVAAGAYSDTLTATMIF